MSTINWSVKTFSELSTDELYDLLKLRVDVFVVEQTCYYPELDELDRHPETRHLLAYQNNNLVGYLRVLPKATSYPEYISIGRVAIAKMARGSGLGHQLMKRGLSICQHNFADQSIKISAQLYLEAFYQSHGFDTVSEMYLEDGIEHIAMIKAS